MSEESRLINVIGLLYESVLDESRWPEAVQSLYTILGGRGAVHMTVDPQNAFVTHNESFGIDPAIPSLFQRYYATREIRIPPALRFPIGTVMPDAALVEMRTLKGSELFNDFLIPHDIPYIMGIWLEKSDKRFSSLSIQGGLRRGPFDASEVELFSKLVPHIARCVRLREQLLGLRQAKQIYMRLLDNYPFGIVLLDEFGYVLEMTSAAYDCVRGADGLRYSQRRIRAWSMQDDSRLQQAIRNAVRPGRGHAPVGATVTVTRHSAVEPFSVTLTPATQSDCLFTTVRVAGLMLIMCPGTQVRPRVEAIQNTLRLTRAEARLAEQLFSGISLREAADQLGRSINTCKSQLKSIYSKTGCRTHVDLVKTMMINALGSTHRIRTQESATTTS